MATMKERKAMLLKKTVKGAAKKGKAKMAASMDHENMKGDKKADMYEMMGKQY